MRTLFRQITMLLAVTVIPASASAWLQWKQGKWDAFRDHSVPLAEISLSQQPILWVDARSAKEYRDEHIPGAIRLTEDDWNDLLPEFLKAWEPELSVVIYCNNRSCHSSEEVAKRLREEVGLSKVLVLRGGWEAWKGAHR